MPKRKNVGSTTEKRTAAKDHKNEEQVWSKSKKKRMRRFKKQRGETANNTVKSTDAQKLDESRPGKRKDDNQKLLLTTSVESNNGTSNETLNVTSCRPRSALQEAFMARLSGSRFRELNEVGVSFSHLLTSLLALTSLPLYTII
jgi:hypothetical protein